MNNQGNKGAQKQNEKYPENKLKGTEDDDLNDLKFKTTFCKNLMIYRKTEKSNSRKSEIKSMNKRSTSPKRVKV